MADSFDKFSIGIDVDVSALESKMQVAENTLKKFKSALKDATSVGEVNYLNRNISGLESTIANLKKQAGGLGKPMGDATQSLINFSRIAQDAPYGILGVANNLNPMLESFQRLSATEGGTTKALKAMAAGLIGPAGVGVALGIVSSLAVTFSKEISAFFRGSTAELDEFRKKLKETADDIYKLIGQEQTKRTKGILLTELIVGGNPTQQQEALKQLQSLYSNSAAIKNAKLGQDKAFYQTLVNQAAMQGDAIAKEKNNTALLEIEYTKQFQNEKKRNEELKKITSEKLEGVGASTRIVSVAEQKKRINDTFNILGDEIKNSISNLQANTYKQLSTITLTPSPETIKKGGDKTIDALVEFSANLKYELAKQLMDIETYKKRFKKIDTSYIPFVYKEEPVKDSVFSKKEKERLADPTQNSLGIFLTKNTNKLIDSEVQIKKTQKAYEDFASSISKDVSNALMGMWNDMQHGESVMNSIGNMLGRLAEQFVAAALQAAVFAGIMSLLTGGVAGGGLSFAGYFMKAFGMAEGGVVTGPTHALIGEGNESEAVMPLSKLSGMLNTTFNAGAMNGGAMASGGSFVLKGNDLVLALQRSNYSLNLRRGV